MTNFYTYSGLYSTGQTVFTDINPRLIVLFLLGIIYAVPIIKKTQLMLAAGTNLIFFYGVQRNGTFAD